MTRTPLTEAQSGLWYAQRLDPANPIFNTGQYLDVRGELDLARFTAAVAQAGVEAEALSLRFVDGPDGPGQILCEGLRPELELIDLSSEADPHAAALAAIRARMQTPVDLARGPIAAQTLYRLEAQRHLWAQQVHHLANDGYGMVLLTSRVAELYRGAGGRALGGLAAVWAEDAAYRTSGQRRADGDWWRATMAGLPDVGGMAPGRAVSAHAFHRHEQPMEADTRNALLALATASGISWPDALTALTAAYARRFIGTAEIVIGVPHMGRFGSASARVPAMVMNVLPVRLSPSEEGPIASWLASAAQAMGEARRHGRYRSEQLRRNLGLLGGSRRLYGPLVNVQPYDRPPRFPGLEVELHVTGTGPVEDIHFTFRGDAAKGLTVEVDANPDLYSWADVSAHGERLATFLRRATSAERLADVPTATPAEMHAELERFNATAHPVPDTTLAALVEATMRECPAAPALRHAGETLTYTELDRRSAALALALRARGCRAETIVAVALPRSIELVVALVAVVRAGGAFLPLDLEHPAGRISAILNSAKPAVVLALDDPFGLYGDRLLAPADWPQSATGALSPPGPDDAAYVLYTSGSTGEPKGVVVSHRAIVNRLLWMRAHYGFGPHDRILQKTPASFDVSVWEFFLSFVSGGLLVVAPPGAHRDPAQIAALVAREGITALHFVPSMLAVFLDAPESANLRVNRVFCSGEALSADLRNRFHARMHAELHNLYGPTEAAVDVSFWAAAPGDDSNPVPIGHPVWNTRLLLLDDHLRPVPPGVAGQLHLGGVQLARGYLGRPDLTAERFIADPFHPGERLYRTGDLARRRADGAIVFLGRADEQVKIRGMRIEPGEIEAAIAASGLAQGSAVIERDGRLVGYVVPGSDYSAERLRAFLALRLPEYMLPAAFVELEALPTTASGKLDRKALPAPLFESAGGDAPTTPTGRKLAALYAEALGLDGPVTAQDDFFALGGDSLSAVRLLLRVRGELGREAGLAALFEHPDVAGLAAFLDADTGQADAGLGPIIPLVRGDSALPPLFLVHPAGGLSWGYRTLASALSPRRTVFGLQAPALDVLASPPASIEALAADYARRMVEAFPAGPFHVAGWSVGGFIAQAIAVELQAAGHAVGLVALLDAYPAECWRAEPEPTQAQALRALLAIAGEDPEAHPELVERAQILDFLRRGDSPLGNLPPEVLDGVIRVVLDTNRLVRGHQHQRFHGTITHVRAALDHKDRPQLTPGLWAPHAAGLRLVEVPFLHPQLTGPEASALIAPILSEGMAMRNGEGEPT